MINAFSGEKLLSVDWRIILGLKICVREKATSRLHGICNVDAGGLYSDCVVRKSDFVVHLFIY
jgi:hypothetical protein